MITRELKINCDNCGGSLKRSHFLQLKEESHSEDQDVCWSVHIMPMLNRSHEFCGFECLKKWLDN